MSSRFETALIGGFLGLCMLLGGTSRLAPIPWVIIELASIVALVGTVLRRRTLPSPQSERTAPFLLAAMTLVGLAYLVPLPPAIWTAMPGRGPAIESFKLLGAPLPWLPLAMDPWAALASVLGLLPAIAAYRVTVTGGRAATTAAALTIIVVAAASAFLSLVQLALDKVRDLRLYGALTSVQGGLFANSNHNAIFLLIALVMLAGLGARFRAAQRDSATLISGYGALALVAFLLVFGIVLNGSVAGLLLLMPAIIGSVIILRNGQPGVAPIFAGVGVVLIGFAAVAIALTSPMVGDFARTGAATVSGLDRLTFYHNTWRAIVDYFPVGSGPGSFAAVYPRYENPNVVTDVFINHAHNDYLEIVLETGLAGVLLLFGFLGWWARRVWRIWSPTTFASPLTRGATLAILLVLAHSVVDYPMRTATVMTAFAICCAMLSLGPIGESQPQEDRSRKMARTRRSRHLEA